MVKNCHMSSNIKSQVPHFGHRLRQRGRSHLGHWFGVPRFFLYSSITKFVNVLSAWM